jgi:putative flippase GtrA
MIKYVKNLFSRKEIRFLFVGGINTTVGYGSYALMIFLGLPYIIAQSVSTIIGTINSYFWNKYFTFKQPQKSIREVLRFILVYGASYVVNVLLLFVCVELLGVNEYGAGLIGLIFTTAISYIGHNFFSFKKSKLGK